MEFKRLSDVEVVAEPTESANVLIEEDGVIKKAPKTAVGGAGGSEWDAVIHFSENIALDYASIVSGGYDELKAKLIADEMPKIAITYSYEYGDMYYYPSIVLYVATNSATDSNITIHWYCNTYVYKVDMAVDGTFSNLQRCKVVSSWTTL